MYQAQELEEVTKMGQIQYTLSPAMKWKPHVGSEKEARPGSRTLDF